MALQFVRGHETGNFQERFYTQTSQMLLRVAAAQPDYVLNFLAERGEDASADAVAKTSATFSKAAKTVKVTLHKNDTVEAILRGPADLFPYLFHRKWTIARSKAPFLTSDRPVLLYEKQDPSEAWRGIGLGTADMILFVLDRHRVLIMQDPLPEHRERVVACA